MIQARCLDRRNLDSRPHLLHVESVNNASFVIVVVVVVVAVVVVVVVVINSKRNMSN